MHAHRAPLCFGYVQRLLTACGKRFPHGSPAEPPLQKRSAINKSFIEERPGHCVLRLYSPRQFSRSPNQGYASQSTRTSVIVNLELHSSKLRQMENVIPLSSGHIPYSRPKETTMYRRRNALALYGHCKHYSPTFSANDSLRTRTKLHSDD